MLNAFRLDSNHHLQHILVRKAEELADDCIWLDLIDPTPQEREWLGQRFGQDMPELAELVEIEASARYAMDEDGLHARTYFLHRDDGITNNVTVAFTIRNGRLFSLHSRDLPEMRVYRLRARGYSCEGLTAQSLLLDLLDVKVEFMADTLEEVHADLESLARRIFNDEVDDFRQVVLQLAQQEDINGKVRLGLHDTKRVVVFLLRYWAGDKNLRQKVKEITRDTDSLVSHAEFLFGKTNHLLDSAMSMVGIEQNRIIKIFSVAAMVFMPPTLIASIYGMNFDNMPELKWEWGYPFAILAMVASAVAPYFFFKRRGWL